MKTIEQNMDQAGWGRVMEVPGSIYARRGINRPDEEKFFANGDRDLNNTWEKVEPAILRFQEFQPGGQGRAQYVPHRYANWKSAKVIATEGPGNLRDKGAHPKAMKTETETYSDYTAQISDDPSYYGPDCSQDDARRIVESLTDLIKGQFPGIAVNVYSGIGKASTEGPDVETREEIDTWIQENWTAAL